MASGTSTPPRVRQRQDSISVVEEKRKFGLMTKISVSMAMCFIKSVTFVYSVISWPVYSLFSSDQPYTKDSKDVLAVPTGKMTDNSMIEDNSSPWRSIDVINEPLHVSPFPDVTTVPHLFLRGKKLWPNKQILGVRKIKKIDFETQPNGRKFKKFTLDKYEWFDYEALEARIENIIEGSINFLKLKPGNISSDKILILSETRLEWQLVAQAAFRIGVPIVTLFSTLGDDAIIQGVNETEVEIIFTSDELLANLIKLLSQMPTVKFVIYMRPPEHDLVEGNEFSIPSLEGNSNIKLISLFELEEKGKTFKSDPSSRYTVTPDDLALIMYTSGSTGAPKGVEITHRNIIASIAGFSHRFSSFNPDDRFIAYLPLAHILELCCELYMIGCGVCLGYGSALTLVDNASKIKKGTKGDVRELRPTLMACVPTILDRLHKTVWEQVNESGLFFIELFKWAIEFRRKRIEHGFPSLLMDRLVFRRIRRVLGGKVRLMMSGGAPLSEASQEFINYTFCRIVQGYGLTETCASGTLGSVNNLRCGHTGAPISSVEIQLRPWVEGGYSPNDVPRPRGEILIGGAPVCRGYYRQPEKTAEDFFSDKNGQRWFCTGDIGLFHADGTLSIVDRKKDLVKLQMGEYISLAKVELALTSCDIVEQICIYGDGFASSIVALIVPKRKALLEMARKVFETATNDESATSFLKMLPNDLNEQNYNQLLQNSRVKRGALKMLEMTGRDKKLSTSEIPSAVYLTSTIWTPDNGLLTAALKLKRRAIQQTFQPEIDAMYNRRTEE